jgi:hypothetical protein
MGTMEEQKNRTGLLLGILLLLLIIAAVVWQTGLLGDPLPTFDATVTGKVTIDGSPANRGTVTFFPADGSLPSTGAIEADGTYVVRTGRGDIKDPTGPAIHSGEYTITAFINAPPTGEDVVGEGGPPRPGPSLIAAKYRNKTTSGLQVTIKPGSNQIDLTLEGPAAEAGTDAGTEASADSDAAADTDQDDSPGAPAEEAGSGE